MVKMFFAHTMEIDDPKAAAADILGQFRAEDLLRNSVGLVTFHVEFVKNRVLEAISRALPFDIVGISTSCSSVAKNYGEFILTLTILTSDDVSFAAGMSEPFEGEAAVVSKLYSECASKLPSVPSFIFSIFPLSPKVSGEDAVDKLDKVSGGLPNFGILSLDYGTSIERPFVSFASEAYENRFAIILFCGDVRPSYTVDRLVSANIISGTAFSTKSEGHFLTKINAMPAAEFFYKSGILERGDYVAQSSTMLLLDSPEFTDPSCMALFGPEEDGSFFCGGEIPVGSSISLAVIDKEYALKFTEEVAAKFKSRKNGVMIFSCATYQVVFELDTLAGMKKVREVMGESVPYLFAYTGGEICPSKTIRGGKKNRFHNASIIALSFD
jgi:hypothetical protein